MPNIHYGTKNKLFLVQSRVHKFFVFHWFFNYDHGADVFPQVNPGIVLRVMKILFL